ncbi:8-oxo-dGTP diphosphatase [Virgibacillus sp. C22-A2]|uniref:8-oxo-dGTP diphosphatase n=1 Tax=Virgibacillus tibetensis TaxID=3042313 RepID=A0ABU6KKS3_9BACI|nr:8-oxo-dGTP diphosphatase [Virgibacillus sp. C22-A2]
MYKHTLCFIKKKDKILMLNRKYSPLKGLWNGVGGKIDEGETETQCVIREVKEETEIDVSIEQIKYKGIITYEFDNSFKGGIHIYLVDIPNEYEYLTPKTTDEGILDWKEITWLLSEDNYGVDVMIPRLLPTLIIDPNEYQHNFVIENNDIKEYTLNKIVN